MKTELKTYSSLRSYLSALYISAIVAYSIINTLDKLKILLKCNHYFSIVLTK